MINVFLRYFHTIRHLKKRQIFYQLYNKAKLYKPFTGKRDIYRRGNIVRLNFEAYDLINSAQKQLGIGFFNFLNIEHRFIDKIDWNLIDYGKLWYYNLQYFDYLFGDDCDDSYKNELIEDASLSILNGSLKLEPYPVSLRIINWILYYSKTGYVSNTMEAALKVQIGYLRNNIEHHIQANHLIENYTSLLVSSYFLKDLKLFSFSSKRLIEQLEIQILPDGGHYEGSPMYHEIMLSKLMILFELEKKQPLGDREYLTTLQAFITNMFGWINTLYFKNGDMPLLNDSISNISPGLATLHKVRSFLDVPNIEIAILNQCGFRKLSNVDFELIVNVGNIVPSYQPSHRHSDMLSFCLHFKQKSIMVDMGISTYENNSTRQFERSSEAHNTITIDHQNQSDVWSSFRIGKRAKTYINHVDTENISAFHDGYMKKYKVNHHRDFSLTQEGLSISDKLMYASGGISTLKGECRFYFNQSVIVKKLNNSIIADDVILTFENESDVMFTHYDQPKGYNIYLPATYVKVEFVGYMVTNVKAA